MSTITISVCLTCTVFATHPGPVLTELFETPNCLSHWHIQSGHWGIRKQSLHVNAKDGEAFIFWGKDTWQNYEIDVDVRFLKVNNPSRWVSVIFRGQSQGQMPWSQFPIRFKSTASNGTEFAVKKKGQWQVRAREKASHSSKLDIWRHLKIVVRNHTASCYLDHELMIQSALCIERSRGCIGFGASGCIADFDNLKLTPLPDTIAPVYDHFNPKWMCVAHRGYSAKAPENTLRAIHEAVTIQCDAVEFDVRQSKDGIPLLMHDSTVNRTTNGKGKVLDLPFSYLKGLDAGKWKASHYTGEHIPTVNEVLSYLSGTNCKGVIEFKDNTILPLVLTTIKTAGIAEQVYLLSSSQALLAKAHASLPQCERVWLCYSLPRECVSPVQQAEWVNTQLKNAKSSVLDVHYSILSPELIHRLHQMNISIWTWTVNDRDVMQTLLQWGVDAITTDHPNYQESLTGTLR